VGPGVSRGGTERFHKQAPTARAPQEGIHKQAPTRRPSQEVHPKQQGPQQGPSGSSRFQGGHTKAPTRRPPTQGHHRKASQQRHGQLDCLGCPFFRRLKRRHRRKAPTRKPTQAEHHRLLCLRGLSTEVEGCARERERERESQGGKRSESERRERDGENPRTPLLTGSGVSPHCCYSSPSPGHIQKLTPARSPGAQASGDHCSMPVRAWPLP